MLSLLLFTCTFLGASALPGPIGLSASPSCSDLIGLAGKHFHDADGYCVIAQISMNAVRVADNVKGGEGQETEARTACANQTQGRGGLLDVTAKNATQAITVVGLNNFNNYFWLPAVGYGNKWVHEKDTASVIETSLHYHPGQCLLVYLPQSGKPRYKLSMRFCWRRYLSVCAIRKDAVNEEPPIKTEEPEESMTGQVGANTGSLVPLTGEKNILTNKVAHEEQNPGSEPLSSYNASQPALTGTQNDSLLAVDSANKTDHDSILSGGGSLHTGHVGLKANPIRIVAKDTGLGQGAGGSGSTDLTGGLIGGLASQHRPAVFMDPKSPVEAEMNESREDDKSIPAEDSETENKEKKTPISLLAQVLPQRSGKESNSETSHEKAEERARSVHALKVHLAAGKISSEEDIPLGHAHVFQDALGVLNENRMELLGKPSSEEVRSGIETNNPAVEDIDSSETGYDNAKAVEGVHGRI